ncbi:unnamed protein product [Rotaria sp. Silwood1]|nr:unnamed protein product [Rotaria sp. Silwood1]CAF1599567.1 unnamed protein product [Rotaria sp. Silwood1]
MTETLTTDTNCSIRQLNFSLTEEFHLINDENLEEMSIIWLDSNIHKTDDCLEMMNALRSIINDLHAYDNIDKCINYINSIRTDEKIVFIVSGPLGEKIIPDIYQSPKIVSIYIFCYDKTKHEVWSNQYKAKIQGVFNEKNLLYSKLISDVNLQLRNFLPISVLSENAKQKSITDLNRQSTSFMWFQLLIGILIHLKHNEHAKDEMINACRKQYKGNTSRTEQIEKFSSEYNPNKAVEWYCQDSFVYRLLNRALRTENIDIIYEFRKTYVIAEEFVDSGTFNYPKVVFTIKINNSIDNDHEFATIQDMSNFSQEEEILFTIGTVFRVDLVEQVTDTFWSVELSLENQTNVELQYVMNNKHDEGIEYLKKAQYIKLKYVSSNSQVMISTYNKLAMIYRHKADYRNSLENYKKKILVIKLSLDDSDPKLAAIYNNIALLYTELDNNDEALFHYRKALELEIKFLPSNHDKIGTTYNNIALLYRNKRHYGEALNNYEKAREVYLNNLGKDHPNVASVYHNIGDTYYKIGQFDKAFDYFKEVIDIQSKFLSENHVDLAKSFNSIAAIYCDKENYDKALEYCKRTHDIQSKLLPKKHPDLATTYVTYGTIYLKLNNHSEALKYYEDSLEIMLTLYKDDHSDLQSTYDAIGEIYFTIENYEKVLKIQLKMLPQTENKIHITYNCLGLAYSKQGNYLESMKNFEKALQIPLKPENQLETAIIFSSIGFNYQSQRNYREALRYYEKTIEIHSNLLTRFHRNQVTTYSNMGAIYFDEQKYKEALKYFKIVLNIQMKYFETNYLDQVDTYNKIGHTYRKLKEYHDAMINYRKALEVQSNHIPLNDYKFAKTFYNIGFTFYEQENLVDALVYFTKALEIQSQYTHEQSEDLAIIYNNIAGVYLREENYEKALFNANQSLKHCPKDYESSIASYDIIADIHLKQNHFLDVLNAYSEKIDIMKEISYENRLELSKTYHTKKLEYYRKELDIRLTTLQSNYSDLVVNYQNLSMTYYQLSEFVDAFKINEMALKIASEHLSNHYENLITLYSDAGAMYFTKERL